MAHNIISVWSEELQENVETAFVNDESVYVVSVDVRKYTEYELMKMKRKWTCDKYGVVYGKKMHKFEKVNNMSDDEFDLMCRYLASGHSKKDSFANARLKMKYELNLP